jgi:hypothetical protein
LLLPYQSDSVQMVVGTWPTPAQLDGFDYWVISPGDPTATSCAVTPVHVQGGYVLYRVRDIVRNGQWVCTFSPAEPG